MIVCEKYKVIYSDIAKCASSSIKKYFDTQKIDKLVLSFSKFEEYKNYFSFTFVRNPWERMVSIYTNKILSPHKFDPNTGVDICFARYGKVFNPDMTFNQFVKAVIDLDQTQLDSHIQPQYWRTCSENTCDIILTFIGRLENSANDWYYICKNSGMPFSALFNVNKINRSHYSLYYNSESKDMVSKHWEKDINLFNYSFEDKK
jgi:chondroitin 4-sulfotransferase 11